ncbi:hypothetical protein OTBS_2097 [Orientia tsutsugamushi str. Boryong]|uniref:Uncharacterized protein n=1 Tax=Orientia tsutsugamushi (strain Boryong) TaxID=357244 RepID=A5CE21_ORITB|nr:hypothetical protein OTBS_1169 [Orientia tsutsugamushi str. Boryong]CAM81192.1 hypothetical protein OTBS_2097 [Orientia tsutsugamushi str. Boryong]
MRNYRIVSLATKISFKKDLQKKLCNSYYYWLQGLFSAIIHSRDLINQKFLCQQQFLMNQSLLFTGLEAKGELLIN